MRKVLIFVQLVFEEPPSAKIFSPHCDLEIQVLLSNCVAIVRAEGSSIGFRVVETQQSFIAEVQRRRHGSAEVDVQFGHAAELFGDTVDRVPWDAVCLLYAFSWDMRTSS